MAYVGVLFAAGALICLFPICAVIVRFKDLRMRRVLGSLEWLATNAPGRWEGANNQRENFHREETSPRTVWERAKPLFHAPASKYLSLVWNAKLHDLYWANRFGAELQRLALSPLPQEPGNNEPRERQSIVRTHIRDFVLIAQRLLALDEVEGRHGHE